MMIQLKPLHISITTLLIICGLGLWPSMVSVVDGYRDDSRILKWSPAWLSTDPERYSETINRGTPLRGLYYKRLWDEVTPQKWSPWYLPNRNVGYTNNKRAPQAWDGGDNYASAGSPEWFRDDELVN